LQETGQHAPDGAVRARDERIARRSRRLDARLHARREERALRATRARLSGKWTANRAREHRAGRFTRENGGAVVKDDTSRKATCTRAPKAREWVVGGEQQPRNENA
jgi:hypothetical protein